jgi:hypothetical protein
VLVWDVLSGEVVFERQVEGSSSFVQFSPKHNHLLMIWLQARRHARSQSFARVHVSERALRASSPSRICTATGLTQFTSSP